jgi:hypothetical protein
MLAIQPTLWCRALAQERAVVDLGPSIFSDGQAYVALSRVRTLEGLAVSSLCDDRLRLVDLAVTNEYARMTLERGAALRDLHRLEELLMNGAHNGAADIERQMRLEEGFEQMDRPVPEGPRPVPATPSQDRLRRLVLEGQNIMAELQQVELELLRQGSPPELTRLQQHLMERHVENEAARLMLITQGPSREGGGTCSSIDLLQQP